MISLKQDLFKNKTTDLTNVNGLALISQKQLKEALGNLEDIQTIKMGSYLYAVAVRSYGRGGDCIFDFGSSLSVVTFCGKTVIEDRTLGVREGLIIKDSGTDLIEFVGN